MKQSVRITSLLSIKSIKSIKSALTAPELSPSLKSMSLIELVITSREKDLGGFSVRRILPYVTHRMVGPFIFFDHMGPAQIQPPQSFEVRPHPHIGLSTVTYLFEGAIRHRDSLGNDQLIEPGDINWMTAGRGIVHSERRPDFLNSKAYRLNGIQLWVALPSEQEEMEPDFTHYPKSSLPEFQIGSAQVKLLLGEILGFRSPVVVQSDLFYLEVLLPAGGSFELPVRGLESAVYVVEGSVKAGEHILGSTTMAVAKKGSDLHVEALTESRLMFLGGQPVGERWIDWNFVASSGEKLSQARSEWASGPGSQRFPLIPGDDKEFIPLPPEPGKTKARVM